MFAQLVDKLLHGKLCLCVAKGSSTRRWDYGTKNSESLY